MPDTSGRRAQIVMACLLICCALIAAAGLCVSAGRDGGPMSDGLSNRAFGLVMAGVGAAVGIAMMLYSKPGETQYCGFLLGMMLAAMLTGAYSYKPTMPQQGQRAEQIPLTIKDWIGQSLPVDESTIKALRTSDIIMRHYVRGDDTVTLAVIFSVGKRRSAHPPEQCYSASGHEMDEIEYDTFDLADGRTVDCKHLIINRRKQRTAVLYWYKADDLNTASLARMSIHSIIADLMMSSGTRVALIRLTTSLTSLDKRDEALALLKEFARDALPEMEKALARAAPSTPQKPTSTEQK